VRGAGERATAGAGARAASGHRHRGARARDRSALLRAQSRRFGTPFELCAAIRWWPRSSAGSRRSRAGATSRVLAEDLQRSESARAAHVPLGLGQRVPERADLYRESDVARALEAEREQRRSTSVLALLGLLPTGLALLGAGLALRDVVRGGRRALFTAPLLLSVATLGSFALFAWRVPIWSALKASYLLGLSLPFALLLCRAIEELLERGRRRACAVLRWLGTRSPHQVAADGWCRRSAPTRPRPARCASISASTRRRGGSISG
jgi:hypothetical protein